MSEREVIAGVLSQIDENLIAKDTLRPIQEERILIDHPTTKKQIVLESESIS